MANRHTTRGLSDPHEEFLIEILGGHQMPGSGNQAYKPMDGRHTEGPLMYSWDGKATRAKSVSIPISMWEKAIEQSHEARPALAIRFCDEHGDPIHDLMVVDLHDFAELRELAVQASEEGYE